MTAIRPSNPAVSGTVPHRSRPLRLSALLIDVDGVLYDDSCWKRWIFKLVRRFHAACTYEEFGELWESHFVVPTACGHRNCREALRGCLSELQLTSSQLDEACAAGIAQQGRLHESLQPLPGVRRGLALLQGREAIIAGLGHCPCGHRQLQSQLARLDLLEQLDRLFSVREFAERGVYEQRFEQLREQLAWGNWPVAFVSTRSGELAAAREAGFLPIGVGERVFTDSIAQLEQFDELLELVRFGPLVTAKSA